MFADANTTTLKGFWPVPAPEQPSGFAGGRVSSHIHFGRLADAQRGLAEGGSVLALQMYQQLGNTRRGEGPAPRYFRRVEARPPVDSAEALGEVPQ